VEPIGDDEVKATIVLQAKASLEAEKILHDTAKEVGAAANARKEIINSPIAPSQFYNLVRNWRQEYLDAPVGAIPAEPVHDKAELLTFLVDHVPVNTWEMQEAARKIKQLLTTRLDAGGRTLANGQVEEADPIFRSPQDADETNSSWLKEELFEVVKGQINNQRYERLLRKGEDLHLVNDVFIIEGVCHCCGTYSEPLGFHENSLCHAFNVCLHARDVTHVQDQAYEAMLKSGNFKESDISEVLNSFQNDEDGMIHLLEKAGISIDDQWRSPRWDPEHFGLVIRKMGSKLDPRLPARVQEIFATVDDIYDMPLDSNGKPFVKGTAFPRVRNAPESRCFRTCHACNRDFKCRASLLEHYSTQGHGEQTHLY
jgi:hypothetical protein